jgi:hypothetical protein
MGRISVDRMLRTRAAVPPASANCGRRPALRFHEVFDRVFDRENVHAHSTLRTNGMRSNSLKTIRVATLHPSLARAAKNAFANAASVGRAFPANGSQPSNRPSSSPKFVRSRARRAGGALRG